MIRKLIVSVLWLFTILVLALPAIAIDKGSPQPVKDVQPLEGFDRHWPDGCYTLSYSQSIAFYWQAPHPTYGDWAYAERFTTPKPARLLSVDIPIYDPGDGTFGNDDVYITVYDDNSGLPGTELAACTLVAGSYPFYPNVANANFQKFNLIFDGDFHIGFSSSAVYGSGDYESLLSDDEFSPLGRSSSIWDAVMGWVDMLSGWGNDVDFVIFANLCDVSPCVAYGDCNQDGMPLTAADMSYLAAYVANNPAPTPLMWQCDMNGDCVTDSLDVVAYTEYFIYGMSAFDKYGGYPVPSCCGDSAHKMHYPQLPDETGWDVNATAPMVLADDWQCSETGYVKDIHFWGSWRDGLEGVIDSFSLSIHSDIPADVCYATGDCNNDGAVDMTDVTCLTDYIYGGQPPDLLYLIDMNGDCNIDLQDITLLVNYISTGDPSIFDPYGGYPVPTCCDGASSYSRPGTTLRDWYVSDFEIIPIDPPTMEGWYDPLTNDIRGNNHQAYFQYNIFLDTSDWFWQEAGTIYWLNISAIIEDETYQWGWKSSINHWNDDAVWAQWGTLDWVEMYEPEQPAIVDTFGLMLDSYGEVMEWWGTDYYGEGWYTYPSGWINMWFYDHPFDSTRYKDITISFNVMPINPTDSSYVEIAVNWSTDWWSLEGNPLPEDRRPPLPGDDEAAFIGRYTHLAGHDIAGSYTFDFTIPEYNPEWVSIDIQGFNVVIENGEIRHECKSYYPVSLDLSFVITGDSLGTSAPTGACCYDDGTGLQSGCIVTTQANCEIVLGGVYMGDGTSCMGIEACCLSDGTCINADAWCCEVVLGGVPQGPGSVCTAPQACCFPDNSCLDIDPMCCLLMGGVPQGFGTVCDANGDGIDDACDTCKTDTLLLNTGYDQILGSVYPIGAYDAYWTITCDPDNNTNEDRPASVISPISAWKPALPNTQWISSYPTWSNDLNGLYCYEYYFCLADNFSNAKLYLELRADDSAAVYLNGNFLVSTPISSFLSTNPTTHLEITQSYFQAGQNRLKVHMVNVSSVASGLNLAGYVTADGIGLEESWCCDSTGIIQGSKFNDLNGDCVWDLNEPALSGWTIVLNPGNITTVTDAFGNYYFTDLVPGIYTITEVVQTGWVQTCPVAGLHNVTLGANQIVSNIDFGNQVDDDPLQEHKMHYPQWPDETGWDVNATYPLVLADDWECSETGYVKDIHFWGSWIDGYEGTIDSFRLSIHSDIPYALPMYPYSRPGELLWDRYITDFTTTSIWPETWEGWYDPETGDTFYNDHQEYFRYDVYLDSLDWFEQDSGTVYWLDISGFIGADGVWGWKSSNYHWNDDAVWGHFGMDDWIDLYEPGGATSAPIVNDFSITMSYGEPLDWGGSDYYGEGWYYYWDSEWWNMWFYDHPYDNTRYKNLMMEFDLDVVNPTESSYIEIAFNWSTDWWSIFGNPPGDPRVPPLPGDDEIAGIGRRTVLAGDVSMLHGHHIFEDVIADYNPEWVSIDVRGDNFRISNGRITHECVSDQPMQSLDLSFVITGEPPRLPFKWWHHYRGVDNNAAYDTCTSGFLTVWGTVDCDTTGHDPIFADTTYKCITYGGLVPDWANDILWNFKWHCFCHNDDWFKLTAPTYVGGKWVLQPLNGWWAARYYSTGVEQIILPSIGDITGTIGAVYYVVDLPVWLAAIPRNWQDTYEITNGTCDDLPGYYFSTTPITFNEDAPPDRGTGPFEGDNLTGTLYLDGEVTAGNSLPAVCGDANGDETINVGDAVYMINYVFKGGTAPDPECAGDANGDATLNVGDAVWLINYVFKAGPAPVDPCCQ